MMLNKKRISSTVVRNHQSESADILIENLTFRLPSPSLLVAPNAFAGLRFNACGNVSIKHCTIIGYKNVAQQQTRGIEFSGGGGNLVVEHNTFIDCAYGCHILTGTYASLSFKYNVFSEMDNPARATSLVSSNDNDARMILFQGATFTNYAEVDKNRWQSVNGMSGDVCNTLSSKKIRIRDNMFLGEIPTAKTNSYTTGGLSTLVMGDNGGQNQEALRNVIVNVSKFGAQIVGEGTTSDINFSDNKILVEARNDSKGKSSMGVQCNFQKPNFTFKGNRVRGYLYTGYEQSIYVGNYYASGTPYTAEEVLEGNLDNDITLRRLEMLPRRIL